MQIITIFDYLLFPLYFFLLLFVVLRKSKKYKASDLQKYFIAGFLMHVLGSILHSAVLQYYYHSGDAFGYYEGGEFIKKSFFHSGSGLKVFFFSGAELSQLPGYEDLSLYIQTSMFTSSSLSAIKFTAFFSIFSFSHFLINALFAGFISFIGIWKLFCLFNEFSEKKMQKPLAVLMIYTPTIWFWGSGMGKDSISIGLLGIFISSIYGLIKKKSMFGNILIILITGYLLLGIKAALVGVVMISSGGYFLVRFWQNTKNVFARFFALLVFTGGVILFFNMAMETVEATLEDAKAMIESNIISYTTETGEAAFTPPEFEISPGGILKAFPVTVFSTLYRPFLWEVKKVIMLFSALESFVMMAGLIFVLFKGGVINFIRTTLGKPAGIFCFIFCTVMAAMVGFTTFNFGTLVRYRLPLLPFYIFLMLLIYKNGQKIKIKKTLH